MNIALFNINTTTDKPSELAQISKKLQYSVAPSYDFIPALDGLRAISVALVILSHLGLQKVVPGILGVTIFFFISGVLITRHLMTEMERSGRIHLSNFYVKRLLRLYPALTAAVVVGGLAYHYLGGVLRLDDSVASIFYFSNYWEIVGGFARNNPDLLHPFGILWSLAVEEHYYIVFPVIVLLLSRRRMQFAAILAFGIAATTIWRYYVAIHCASAAAACIGGVNEFRLLHATDTRIDSILYGALLTALLGTRLAPKIIDILGSRWTFLAGALLILASLAIRDTLFRDTFRFSVQGIGLFCCIGAVLFAPWLGRARDALSMPLARSIGRWSYSLYLWHWIVLMAAIRILPDSMRGAAERGGLPLGQWLEFAVPTIIVSIGVAAASYHFVERPVLNLRKRFGSHNEGSTTGVRSFATADRSRSTRPAQTA